MFRIAEVACHHLRLPLVTPFRTSFGRETEKDTVIVRVRTDAGEGFGEAPAHAAPGYIADTVETVWATTRDWLAPPLVGATIDAGTDLGALWPRVRGHALARAGLEAALWDIRARQAGRPLAALYAEPHGPPAAAIPVGVSVGIQPDVGRLVEVVRGYVAAGYRRVKCKIEPGWDLEPLTRIRRECPALALAADANGAYRPEDLDALRPLDDLGLQFLEQPLPPDHVLAHARWQERLRTPICLDESLPTLQAVREALEAGACRMVNLKPPRVGGMTVARAIRDLCLSRGVRLWCGGMLESGIGRWHNVALAAGAGFTDPGDLSASDRYVTEDVTDPPIRLRPDGTVAVPTGPGLGAAIREDVLARYTVRTLRVG